MRDYYEVLGVPRDATDEQIRRAYRRKIAEVHPDKAGGDAEQARVLGEARRVLLNPAARAAYNGPTLSDDDLDVRTGGDPPESLLDIGERAVNHVGSAVRARRQAILADLRRRLASRFRAKRRT